MESCSLWNTACSLAPPSASALCSGLSPHSFSAQLRCVTYHLPLWLSRAEHAPHPQGCSSAKGCHDEHYPKAHMRMCQPAVLCLWLMIVTLMLMPHERLHIISKWGYIFIHVFVVCFFLFINMESIKGRDHGLYSKFQTFLSIRPYKLPQIDSPNSIFFQPLSFLIFKLLHLFFR